MVETIFKRLVIIGPGLIGGSIARAAKEYGGIAETVVISTRSQKTLDRVAELGFADVSLTRQRPWQGRIA
jgi:cyclohexadieny/prephenate dehydrogenase